MLDGIGNTVNMVFNSAARRLVLVVRTVTAAAVVALALAACSQNAPPITRAATQGGSTSNAHGGSTSTACPTQGVGGDSLPPLCAPPRLSTPTPVTPPATPPATPAAPSVTSVSPSQGSAAGGDSVTIHGTGFCADPQVSFGGVAAQATDESATQIVAISPPEQPGRPTVDITVSCNGSISPAVAADQFTYQSATTSAAPTAPAASS